MHSVLIIVILSIPSVCHTRGLCPVSTWFNLRSWFLHRMVASWF